MAEIFPDLWLEPGALERVILLLRRLPVNAKAKKYALHEWCKWSGIVLTAEMVARVTGLPAGEI